MRWKALRKKLQLGEAQAEAKVAVAEVRREVVTVRHMADPREVAPATATEHAVSAL